MHRAAKSLQFSLHNFNKFRHSFAIFDMKHADSSFFSKKIGNLFQMLSQHSHWRRSSISRLSFVRYACIVSL